MFAVPGWSVSADTLRIQVDSRIAKSTKGVEPVEGNGPHGSFKKRKRGHGSSKSPDITDENLGELWRKHMEGVTAAMPKGESRGSVKKQKRKKQKERNDIPEEAVTANGDSLGDFSKNQIDSIEKNLLPIIEEKIMEKEKEEHEETNLDPEIDNAKIAYRPNVTTEIKDDGNARNERRRAKAATRKEQRALLQADGTLPPTRPEAMLDATNDKTTLSKSPKPKSNEQTSKSADTPVPPIQTTSITSKELSNIPKVLQPPKAYTTPIASNRPASPAQFTKFTPLQQRMAAKLTSARFRYLNQTLYTSPSNEAVQLFANSPQAYASYHAGFRAQVAVWPQNPVEGFIEDVKARGKMVVPSQKTMFRNMKRGKKAKRLTKEAEITENDKGRMPTDPLPRTRGTCTIVDMGCGDANLAGSLQSLKQSLNLNILSFDLAKGDTPNAHLVTVADISKLVAAGVSNGSVDIAICCLSLMGTNWVEVVGECARIVRGGGEVWVAEIKSRFARPGQAKRKGDGIGKKKVNRTRANDEGDEEEDVVASEDLEDSKNAKDDTDISAFLEVFRKRGFHLKTKADIGNKMFVKMHFLKTVRPEKAAENEKGGKATFGEGFRGKQAGKAKFLAGEEEIEVDENKVLKPCVYKIR